MGSDEIPAAPVARTSARDTQETHVVTCFILRRDRGHDEVLIVRRSDRVRTYQGRWAGVSGYVEPSVTPEAQAYVELWEEAHLAPGDVRLLRVGAPLPIRDDEQGLSWVVHPFLFFTDAPERLLTDWEARESRWVAPSDIPGLPTVPDLAAALARVYPPDVTGSDAEPPDAPPI